MQYNFVLPGDYDMSIIERRAQENGHMLDNRTLARFRLWRDSQPLSILTHAQAYNVLHISNPPRK